MGSLRTFLAITVVLSHSYGHIFVGGRLAVQSFYVISGFLISYILLEARSYENLYKFYSNRILRLFPVYYFIAFLTLIYLISQQIFIGEVEFFRTFNELNFLGKFYLIFSNIFILGQDLAFFMGFEDGNLIFKTNYSDSNPIIYTGLISQITWTISLEILFYLIAPFILRDLKIMFALLFLSIFLRALLIYDGIGLTGGFNYRFFPLELALFLLGAFSHQIIKPWVEKIFAKQINKLSLFFTMSFLFYCALFSFIPGIVFNTLLVILLLIIGLPLLFNFQNIYKFDSWIGKFSYPIYVSHWIILVITKDLFVEEPIIKGFMVLIPSLILAFITENFVSSPMEKIRLKNKKSISQ